MTAPSDLFGGGRDDAEYDARDEPPNREVIDRGQHEQGQSHSGDEAERGPKVWRGSDRQVEHRCDDWQQEEADAETGE